jgi:hypothetical protein
MEKETEEELFKMHAKINKLIRAVDALTKEISNLSALTLERAGEYRDD